MNSGVGSILIVQNKEHRKTQRKKKKNMEP